MSCTLNAILVYLVLWRLAIEDDEQPTYALPEFLGGIVLYLASAVLTADAGTSGYARLIVHSVRAYTITLSSDREYSSIILDPGVRSGTNDAWRVTGIARDTISRASAGYVVPLADRDNWDASWVIARIMSNCTRVRLVVTGQFL